MVECVCRTCGKTFHRAPSQIKRGAGKCCSKSCLGELFSGEGNPFYGRTHTDSVKAKISSSRTGKAKGNKNAKGHRHTTEAKRLISDASRQLWKDNREKMLASLPRGETHRFAKPPELRRYRQNFTPRQRREWVDTTCFYCGTGRRLELDHIIPLFDDGWRGRENVQTLCRRCNLWKTHFVDLPRYHARLGRQRD